MPLALAAAEVPDEAEVDHDLRALGSHDVLEPRFPQIDLIRLNPTGDLPPADRIDAHHFVPSAEALDNETTQAARDPSD